MSKDLVVESIDRLIKAVNQYQEELRYNAQILENAANACDAAMGNGEIAKKQIARLHDALKEIEKTAELAQSVSEALIWERKQAVEIYNES